MSTQKQYDECGLIIEYGFKNPALCKENGVLTAYCCICGKYIGSECDTKMKSLIRRQYCGACGEQVKQEQNSKRQQKYRKSKRAMKTAYENLVRQLEQRIDLQRSENRLLREMVVAQRDELDRYKNS